MNTKGMIMENPKLFVNTENGSIDIYKRPSKYIKPMSKLTLDIILDKMEESINENSKIFTTE
jgi:hypothetical protein